MFISRLFKPLGSHLWRSKHGITLFFSSLDISNFGILGVLEHGATGSADDATDASNSLFVLHVFYGGLLFEMHGSSQ
jgi:hypothetical protein